MTVDDDFASPVRRSRARRPMPPEGVLPGELSTVLGGVPDRWSITATAVDLAIRGHLHIHEVRAVSLRRATDWQLQAVDGGVGELSRFERHLLQRVAAQGGTAYASELGGAPWLRAAQRLITQDTVDKGWFRERTTTVRRRRSILGAVLLAGGLFVGLGALGSTGSDGRPLVGMLAAVLAVAGIAMLLTADTASRPTAAGMAVRTEAERFRTYLRDVDAAQVVRERAARQFLDHAPYAIALGLVDRWAGVVRDLEVEGCDLPHLPWYARGGDGADSDAVTVGTRLEGFTMAIAGSTVGAWVVSQTMHGAGVMPGGHSTGAGGGDLGGGGGGDFGGGGGSF